MAVDAVDTVVGYMERACAYTDRPECASMLQEAHAFTRQKWLPLVAVQTLADNFLQTTVANFTIHLLKAIPAQSDELLLRNVVAPMLSAALRFTSWARDAEDDTESAVESLISRAVEVAVEDMKRALQSKEGGTVPVPQ